MSDVIGWGDAYSATHETATRTRFARVVTTPTPTGATVRVEPRGNMVIERVGEDGTVELRAVRPPKPGEQVMVRGRMVSVRRVRRTSDGGAWLEDADTGAMHRWHP